MHRWLAIAPASTLLLVACSPSHSTATPGPLTQDASVDAGSDASFAPPVATRPSEPSVSPLFIGTGGFAYAAGSAFPGALVPQGMAKVGPDTSGDWGTINFLHCSGYWYDDDTIQGFSQMHLHGTGLPDYGILGLMPLPSFGPKQTTASGYASTFDKSTETAVPGKYAVTLQNGNIAVELTATAHVAHHRYTYPASATTAHVVLDLDHHIADDTVGSETLTVDAATQTVTGSLRDLGEMTSGFGGSVLYFAAKTRQPWATASVWSMGKAPAAGTQASGTGVGVDLEFALGSGASHAPIEIQIGLSLTSIAEAAANLVAETPTFDFDGEAQAAAAAWQTATSVVTVEGGTADQQAMMQAAVYHLFLMPTVLSDVDGSYMGMDGKVAKAEGYHYCSDMSLWDTYRTLAPLWDLIAPERSLDAVQSLVAMAKASGYFPRWPIATGESGTMLGASAEVVIADAYVKGIHGFDAEGAYAILRAAAMSSTTPPGGRGGRSNVVPYMQLGYVPQSYGSGVSWTIEYGQDDVALSNFAAALGHTEDAAALATRSHGWQKLYDPVTGLLWSKSADGTWATPHGGPTTESSDFAEADAWQSVWGPWFDMPGLESLMGGAAAFATNLETFFENSKADYDAIRWSSNLSAGGIRKYYWGGNEPDIHAVYLFALAGRPDLTQKWLPWTESEIFTSAADGLPGNDDAGTMSAWLVESMLGFYAIPGTDGYVVGAPAFPTASIAVPGGRFSIVANGVTPTSAYVQSVTLNGAPLTTPTFHFADLKAGGSLVFEMGPAPSTWGQSGN